MNNDDRVQCVRCGNFRACRCFEPIKAQISHRREPIEIGRTLAELPQRCPGYTKKQEQK
jgi:hypothetical protein